MKKELLSSLEALFYFDSLQASGQALASVFLETLVLLGISWLYMVIHLFESRIKDVFLQNFLNFAIGFGKAKK